MEEENPANTNFFFCNICRIYCASALNLQTHFLGNKHKAVEEALKAHGIVKPLSASTSSSGSGEVLRLPQSLPDYVDTETEKSLEKTLEEHLNSCKDTEPAIGLQYILEYRSQNNPIYECNLCTHQGGVTNMFMHVLGIKHRMAYLKKHHPDLADVKGRGSKLVLRLKEVAAKVEEEEGRQRIRTTMDCPVLTDDIYTEEFSDSLITWFTEEDEGKGKKKEDPKPEAKEMDKKAEEASEAKGDDSNKSEDKKEPEQNTVQQFVDIDSDSDEFTTNEGLLKYLKSFEIIDEDDAAFILKVTQKLTDALILYREKASERKNIQEQNQYRNFGDHSEQKTSVGASGPHADCDFSEWELPAEHAFEGTGTHSSVKTPAKRKASELPTDLPKGKVKTCKPGAFAPTKSNDPDSGDAKGAAEPQGPRATSHNARHLDPGRGLANASRNLQGQKTGRDRDARSFIPERRDVPSSLRRQPSIHPSVLSRSESNIVRNVSRSRRNMEVDKVAGTESNPVFSGPRKTVWIIGHSIVYYAEDYAGVSGWGTSLGLEDRLWIKWLGKKDMKWNALLPTISLKVSLLGPPDALIIQLGENDLPEKKGGDLSIAMAADLHTLNSRFPNTLFFWSDMLGRRKWPGSVAPDKVDLVRKQITTEAGRLIESTGGIVIRHPDITFKLSPLFKADGISLSAWGLDIWLHSIRYELLRWLQS